MMDSHKPILADLVFLGGGHAHLAAIKNFAMRPVPGLRLTIVTSDIRTTYSGMLPGYIEGVWQDGDIHIDIVHLAQFAGARLIIAHCTGIDADEKTLFFEKRPPLHFDLLSINIGGQPDLKAIEGAENYAIPVKPITQFQASFEGLLQAGLPEKIAVIGGGAAGSELALAINKRWNEHGVMPHITLYCRSSRLLPRMSPSAAHLMLTALYEAGVQLQLGRSVQKIEKNILYFGPKHQTVKGVEKSSRTDEARKTTESLKNEGSYDACFLVSAVGPPAWLGSSTLALDDTGFISVHPTLQSTSHPHIFAAGDVATIVGKPRPKAGVFAVKAARTLTKNLRKQLFGKSLTKWKTQKRYLAIISTSDGSAIASWGRIGFKSFMFLKLKHWIDLRFMAKYQHLKMPETESPNPFPGVASRPDSTAKDPAFAAMRCLGCSAKTGHKVLEAALANAANIARSAGADKNFLPDNQVECDTAEIEGPPPGHHLVQSVDMLSEIVSDPYMMGHIAAVHAMSDLYATLAQPKSALAVINLPEASLAIQTNQLTQILAGALMALSKAGVKLKGGHTSEGGTLSVGFSVTGHALNARPAKVIHGDNALILTKRLGTGVIMAAKMQLIADAIWVESAIVEMAKSNQHAARLFENMNMFAATDVTGFGLARHAMNLSKRAGAKGCILNLPDIPLLPGAAQLLLSGVRSSLHEQNREAVTIIPHLLDETSELSARVEALFDPQTSGGLLGVLPQENAQNLINQLNETGHDAAIIGCLDFESESVQLTNVKPKKITV